MPTSPTQTPTVHLLGVGGTIAMTGSPEEGVTPTLDATALARQIPVAPGGPTVDVSTFARLPGSHLAFDDVVRMHGRIQELLAAGCPGVVVSQGTDTIEEVAFALDLLHAGEEPIVVTGAMRHPAAPGADGAANLAAAVVVAASRTARGQGALVVLNDEIHAARFVRKGQTSRPSAFHSPSAGPLGFVSELRVHLPLSVGRRVHVELPDAASVARVALVTAAMGDDLRYLPGLADSGYQGVVIAAFGAGHLPERALPSIAATADRVPVVLASRTAAGAVFHHTYGFAGSELDLLQRGLLNAGAIDPMKARVLLSLALGASWGADQIREAFTLLSGAVEDPQHC